MQVNKTRVLKATNGAFDGVTDFLVYGDTVVTVSERTRSLYVVEEFSNTFYYVGRGEYDLSASRMEDVDLQALRVTGDDVTTTITQSNEAILTLSSPRRSAKTMRIFSSAEYFRAVLRRMFLTNLSLASLLPTDLLLIFAP